MILQGSNEKISFKDIIFILIFSAVLFFIRWFFSFYYFDEDLSVKLLFESISDGDFFYPIISFFSDFDFNNSLHPEIDNLKNLPIPIGSILFHTIFYKLFGVVGLFVIDFFGFFFFILIFFLIFSLFNPRINSFCYAVLLLTIPLFIDYLDINKSTIVISQISELFTLRVHRPFPSNIYFFIFIYLLLLIDKEKELKKSHLALLGFVLALSFSSFYYFFLIEVITLSIFLLNRFKNKFFFNLKKNIFSLITLSLIFIFFSLPFIYFIISHEPDVSKGAGVFELTPEKRLFLFKHFASKYLDFKFLIINFIFLVSFCFSNIYKKKNYEIINIFSIIYISSIISPFIFLALSPQSGVLYHFNNNVILCFILLLIIVLVILYNSYINVKFHYTVLAIVCLFSIFIYSSAQFKKNQLPNQSRSEFNKVVDIINLNQENNSSLLTFNRKFMQWAVLNEKIKYLNLTMSGLTPKTSEMIEDDLINVFKFFKLNEEDFLTFFENKKSGWRYLNKNTALFFYMKYTANSLHTFNNSKNFDEETLNHILNSSPLYSQQFAIPNEEFERLKNKFIFYKKTNSFNPDIIILEKRSNLYEKINISDLNYCNMFIGDYFSLYININKLSICNKATDNN